ncbi:uncharacterized protein HaLaN_15339, partial [Haematococcus lacustris]
SAYFAFSAFLAWSDQPIYVLDKDNELDIAKLALANALDILAVQPPGNGPYLLGGHSYGGAVALQVALLLEGWGLNVGLLLVMDTPLPRQVRECRPESEEASEEEVLELMEMILGALGRDAVGLGARRVMRDDNMTVEEVQKQIEFVALSVKKGSQVSDMRHHTFTGHLTHARVVYLRAAERGACDYVDDSRFGAMPHGVCWHEMCRELEVIDVAGDHFSLLRQSKQDMSLVVAALKLHLGAFGWHETVRREVTPHWMVGGRAADPQATIMDEYLSRMGVDSGAARAR